ncbi:hypothetical protein, partial [Mesorhizobium humile]|uniref:hypothetical protein n=1 Tax=Mesorhizobium humile TaxID=3072313 RepID=UPI002A243A15
NHASRITRVLVPIDAFVETARTTGTSGVYRLFGPPQEISPIFTNPCREGEFNHSSGPRVAFCEGGAA